MFDFLTDEVFQIVVITALFVLGVMLFMVYRRPYSDVEKLTQFMDDIDYRLEKMNKKLDELTNSFVNGIIMEDDDDSSSESSSSSSSSRSSKSSRSSRSSRSSKEASNDVSNEVPASSNGLNYDGIEFSDIPNFSTDTSVLDEEVTENVDGKKRPTIVKRIIQTEE